MVGRLWVESEQGSSGYGLNRNNAIAVAGSTRVRRCLPAALVSSVADLEPVGGQVPLQPAALAVELRTSRQAEAELRQDECA